MEFQAKINMCPGKEKECVIRPICISICAHSREHSILLIADTMQINDKICCNHFRVKCVIF